MPHAVIEYSDNIAGEIISGDIVRIVHDIMMNCGLFAPENIKTRSYAARDFLVGPKGRDGSFVHVSVAIINGRTTEQKQTLSTALIEALQEPLPHVDQLTVEIRELDVDTYRRK